MNLALQVGYQQFNAETGYKMYPKGVLSFARIYAFGQYVVDHEGDVISREGTPLGFFVTGKKNLQGFAGFSIGEFRTGAQLLTRRRANYFVQVDPSRRFTRLSLQGNLGEDIDQMYFLAQFTPFEAAQDNPGMQKFLKAMKANGKSPNEILLVGWSGAALLVEGLKAAGKNPTQQGVIDAINQITDWNAGGAIRPVDWTGAHGPAKPGARTCASYVQARDGKFVPLYGEKGKPMICMSSNPYPTTLDDYEAINAAQPDA